LQDCRNLNLIFATEPQAQRAIIIPATLRAEWRREPGNKKNGGAWPGFLENSIVTTEKKFKISRS
jgi:hypothetical protein